MPEFEAPQSRNEAILQNILGADNEILPPFSRIEVLLIELLGYIAGDVPNTVITTAQIDTIITSIS